MVVTRAAMCGVVSLLWWSLRDSAAQQTDEDEWSLHDTAASQTCEDYDHNAANLLQLKAGKVEHCDVLNPQKGLVWTHSKKIGNYTVYSGNLTVPLSPEVEDKDDTPYLNLLVMLSVPLGSVSADLEPLLIHEGGPGTDALSAFPSGQLIDGYAAFAISQRGIGATAQPSFECDPSHLKLPPKNKQPKYAVSDFTDCPCALPDGTPLVGSTFADLDPKNDSQVQVLFEKMAFRSHRCAASSKWMLTGPRGKKYNFLEWSGTRMLAQDIDFFRSRICASKLNLYGVSYGTAVAGTYADMFPDRVAKMVINGNMPPVPSTLEFAQGMGLAQTQAFGHLERMCVEWTATPPCNLFNSEMSLTKAWTKLVAEIRAGQLAAPTQILASGGDNVTFPLSIGLLQGYIQALMIVAGQKPTGWTEPVLVIARLSGLRGQKARVNQVASILNQFCTLPTSHSSESWSGVKTWSAYGVCIGEQSVGLSSSSSPKPSLAELGIPYLKQSGAYVYEATVLGQDLFGRFTVSQAMNAYRSFSSAWEEMATSSFVGMFSAIFSWVPEAVPVQIGFRARVRALVVGNLYDPACSYEWNNHMRESLPDSVMMTWQGVGHALLSGGNYPNSGMEPCLKRLDIYWKTGELPLDGFTCRTQAPVPLGNFSAEKE